MENDNNPIDDLSPGGITVYIIERYHKDLRKRLPELFDLALHVEKTQAHSEDLPIGLSDFIKEISTELYAHMEKEEQILFPLINRGQSNFVKAPIARMEFEHEQHEKNLRRLREVTNNFTVPASASGTLVLLYRALEDFERELLEHVNLENNILFPRALNALVP